MENLSNQNDNIIGKLTKGETVVCPRCGKSIILPANPNIEPSKCHGFYCPKCNYMVNWDPVVIIE